MKHPSLDLLHEFAADRVGYAVAHGYDAMRVVEKHLTRCEECNSYIALIEYPRKKKREEAFLQLDDFLNAKGIPIPERYRDGAECPDVGTLTNYSEGSLHDDQKLVVDSHLKRCTHCAAVVQGVWVPKGVELEAPQNIRLKPKWHVYDLIRDFRLKPAIPAIAVIFIGIVTVGALYFFDNGKWVSRVRGRVDIGQEVVQLMKPENGQTVDISDFEFQWELTRDIAGAHYEVVIWDRPGVPKRFPATKTELSTFEVDVLQRGKTYRWMVEVYVGDDKTSPSALKGQSNTWIFHTRE